MLLIFLGGCMWLEGVFLEILCVICFGFNGVLLVWLRCIVICDCNGLYDIVLMDDGYMLSWFYN